MNKLANLAQAEKYKTYIWEAFGIQKERVLFGLKFGSKGHFPHIGQIDIEELREKLVEGKFLSDLEYSIDYHSINPTTRLDSIKRMNQSEIPAMKSSFVHPSFYSLFPDYILPKNSNANNLFDAERIPEEYFDQIIPWVYNISAPRENVEIYLENFGTRITQKNGQRAYKRGINGLIRLYNNECAESKLEKIQNTLSEVYSRF